MKKNYCWMRGSRRWIKSALFLLVAGLPSFAMAAGTWFSCSPVGVAVFFGARVHVQCSLGYGAGGSIIFFALPAATSTDIQQANEFQSMAMTAISSGKQLSIYFDDADTSGVSFGCGATDCRRATVAVMPK